MRVALVHIKHAASGGVEAYLTNLARHLAGEGHEVSIVCRTHEQPPHPAVRFVQLRPFNLGGAWKMLAFARAVERHLAQTPYDVVYGLGKTWTHDVVRLGGGCHQTYLDLAGDAERRFLHPPGGGWLKNRTALAIERRALAPGACQRVVTNSHMVKLDVCRRHQVPPAQVTVIHNGVDGQRFHPRQRQEAGAALRQACGFTPGQPVVLFLGSGYARKGLDLVLKAFPALLAQRPAARLLVVGYDSSLARYQARARALGVGDATCFLGGRGDVPACYAAADLSVLPTRYDPFANSTLEAMASGLPVITSDANGGAEVITPGVDGEVLPISASAAELSAALVRWSADDRLAVARPAARTAAERHDLAGKMREATAVLEAAAAARRGTARVMKVLVLAFGDPQRAASTIFRVAQYAELLARQGVELEFVERKDVGRDLLGRVAAADVVLNQKCVLSPRLGAAIRARAKRLVFDFDDAMWTRPGRDFSWFVRWRTARRLRWWLGHADAVIAANSYLADWARPHARRLEVLPMTLDLETWRPVPRAPREQVVVGWAGSPAYLRLVEDLEPALSAAVAQEPRLRVAIYCGKRPQLAIPFTYVPYEAGTEAAFVQGLDIGLLPMQDDAFGRGKSPIKSLQYLSCGVPVVGRFVGATHEILDPTTGVAVATPGAWTDALVALARDPARRQAMGAAGIARMHERHDRTRMAGRLLQILRGES